ncbi:hypothetical protein Sfulv_02770 [Streptomyces fulvorobeus]|uniref:Uncharacterized protein n=1 Tax=Streptomyces fulvorobeus TaxID=284028 RepID=A0A7J0C148_9ACTN|nr:hypothetical protein Sfulv_02770 [Streptomyces fulvorobeus]
MGGAGYRTGGESAAACASGHINHLTEAAGDREGRTEDGGNRRRSAARLRRDERLKGVLTDREMSSGSWRG